MPSVPKRSVNTGCFVYNNSLCVISNLKADNENKSDYLENTSVDMYAIDNGEYTGSFYIPEYNDEKLRQVKAINDLLIAIYATKIPCI